MARNGSGTYNLPAGNPVTTGTTISSTWANSTLSDMATALTGSIASDGQTTASGNLPMGGFIHTNVGNATVRTNYTSAGQVQDGTLTYLTSVAGTNTITAVGAVGMTAYATGQKFTFVSAGANTGAATININSIGAKALTKNGATALSAGDIASGSAVEVVYDGTQFQVVSSLPSAASGDVVGPASATDNAVARFNSTTGKLIQNSVVTIADTTGDVSGVGTLNATAISASTGSFSSTLSATGHTTFEGVTSTGATGTGNLVYSIAPTLTGTTTFVQTPVSATTPGANIRVQSNECYMIMSHGTQTTTASYFYFYNGTGLVGQISANGSTTTYATSSDYRLKDNVVPMTNALDTVALLKPVTYTWKVDGSAGQGFIAHELQAVVPDAVTGEKDAMNEDGSIKSQGIDTSYLVATLTAAIQELNAKFEEYKASHP